MGPTTNEQMKKSFRSTCIGLPKKLWVKISSKKFWKDPSNESKIYTKWCLEIKVFGISIILWKCYSWTESTQVEQRKERKDKGWKM